MLSLVGTRDFAERGLADSRAIRALQGGHDCRSDGGILADVAAIAGINARSLGA